VQRRRVVFSAVALAVLVLALVLVTNAPSSTPPPSSHPVRSNGASADKADKKAIPAVEAGVLPWNLGQPLSRQVLLPGNGSAVTVLGGLSPSGTSSSRVYALDVSSGAETPLGALPSGVHDAAGAQLGGKDLVFGGGSPTAVSTVKSFPSGLAPGSSGTVIGQLPQPRTDSSAVVIGNSAYLVGGYDGSNPDPHVLSTSDGVHFSFVTDLSVPVRYGAAAALDNKIYVFGGQAVGGSHSGAVVNTIQMVDPVAKTSKVVGHLGQALVGSSAAVLGGHIYVAGGATGATAGQESSGGSQNRTSDSGAVFAFDPSTNKLLPAGQLPVPIAYGASVAVGSRAWLVGGESNGTPVNTVEMFTPNSAFGSAGASGAGSPFFGARLLIADRGNNRLLLLDDTNQIVWTYPSDNAAPPPGGFYFPDDAFFAKNGTEIISNQEQNETIVIIAFPSGQLVWQYGHPKQPSAAPGYLYEPDDAYLLKNGQVTVADADNCRILFINPDKSVASQIGTNNTCVHKPPNAVGSPNGDTPLADGNVLVSEIKGQWVSEYTPHGQLVWTVHLPIGYPSDPQQVGPDLYLVADYSHPGAIVEFNRQGQILYKYAPTSGLAELNQPSLAELLPSGVFMCNDDYRHRMVAVDPSTQALVWQYGVPDTPGTAPGMLNIPDGFDELNPNGSTPTHVATG
jgi:hypothetical protein